MLLQIKSSPPIDEGEKPSSDHVESGAVRGAFRVVFQKISRTLRPSPKAVIRQTKVIDKVVDNAKIVAESLNTQSKPTSIKDVLMIVKSTVPSMLFQAFVGAVAFEAFGQSSQFIERARRAFAEGKELVDITKEKRVVHPISPSTALVCGATSGIIVAALNANTILHKILSSSYQNMSNLNIAELAKRPKRVVPLGGIAIGHILTHMALFSTYHSLKHVFDMHPQFRLPHYTSDDDGVVAPTDEKVVSFLQDFGTICAFGFAAGTAECVVSHYARVFVRGGQAAFTSRELMRRMRRMPPLQGTMLVTAGLPAALGFLALEFDSD